MQSDSTFKVFQPYKITCIVPTYKPTEITVELIKSLLSDPLRLQIILINDATPTDSPSNKILEFLHQSYSPDQLTYLETTHNAKKAGALNLGIEYAFRHTPDVDIIITFDDDIKITPQTLTHLIQKLYSDPYIGAACTQSLVQNKHQNLLTRIQSLEYLGFTASKIADNNFLQGPLVMQGMLTAFKAQALKDVNGYTPLHLIEDYDITVRLKRKGWKVAIAPQALAWTQVPTHIQQLWRQRIRWGYGGLQVLIQNIKYPQVILQDQIGHTIFILLLFTIILSLVNYQSQPILNPWVIGITILAIIQFIISYTYNIILLYNSNESDWKNWLLKLTIIPEFIYSNVTTLITVGCYLFFVYNTLFGKLTQKIPRLQKPYQLGMTGFNKFGYSLGWGTRLSQ